MIYHAFNKSIADFVIFNDKNEFLRMLMAIRYYQISKPPYNLATLIRDGKINYNLQNSFILTHYSKSILVNIIAYCLMPTHLHLVLEEKMENGLPIYMNNILNSYTRYFNIRHNRKGPLWEGPYKKVAVESDEQLLHLTRYVHLNPVTAYIVNKPDEWSHSSYKEYLSDINLNQRICSFHTLLDINPNSYREFVEDGISYQRELAKIKSLAIE